MCNRSFTIVLPEIWSDLSWHSLHNYQLVGNGNSVRPHKYGVSGTELLATSKFTSRMETRLYLPISTRHKVLNTYK